MQKNPASKQACRQPRGDSTPVSDYTEANICQVWTVDKNNQDGRLRKAHFFLSDNFLKTLPYIQNCRKLEHQGRLKDG